MRGAEVRLAALGARPSVDCDASGLRGLLLRVLGRLAGCQQVVGCRLRLRQIQGVRPHAIKNSSRSTTPDSAIRRAAIETTS